MEVNPKDLTEHQTPPTVDIGKVVTVKFGDDERTFLVATNGDHGEKILPSGISEDMIPENMMVVSNDAPIGKALLGKVEGDAILPDKNASGYKKLGLEVIRIASLEDFLASSDNNDQRDTDDKTDK